MSRHLFIGARPSVMSRRWREAFPDLGLLTAAESDAVAVSGARMVWLVTDQPDWDRRVRRLATDGLPVVVLSLNPSREEGLRALECDARGYVHALAVPELLRRVAVAVENGGVWVGPELLQEMVRSVSRHLAGAARPHDAVLDGLTPREQEVAMAVGAGASNKEVARSLGISERTVKAHLGAVFEKLGLRDRLQLVLRLRARQPATSGAGRG